MIRPDAKPKRVSHIRTREQEDELAIFNIMTAEYAVLNSTGKVIFERCDGTRTIEAIAEELRELCNDPPPSDVILQDTIELVHHLKEQSLVEFVTG